MHIFTMWNTYCFNKILVVNIYKHVTIHPVQYVVSNRIASFLVSAITTVTYKSNVHVTSMHTVRSLQDVCHFNLTYSKRK